MVLGVAMAACLQVGCRAEQPWPLWESYTRNAFDPSGRIVDHSAGDRTTSEGQAYGMFFALVANDRTRFDKLVNWTQDNLAGGDLTTRLPGWSWGKAADRLSWKPLDLNPASDADLWMAYTLLEAGRLWHDPRYDRLGTLMASRIAQQEVALVPGLGTTLLPGPQGFHPDAGTWILNPSYMPPSVLSYLAMRSPSGPWRAILASLPTLLTQGSGGGFAMDWVTAGGALSPAVSPAAQAGGKDGQAGGSYDAIRVYLWLGMADADTAGVQESLTGLAGMANYMKRHPLPPRRVDGNGTVLEADGPVGFSAAVVPYLHANNMKSEVKVQLDRMIALKDPSSGLYGKDAMYYDQNLALFASGWTEQRFRFDRGGRLNVKWR